MLDVLEEDGKDKASLFILPTLPHSYLLCPLFTVSAFFLGDVEECRDGSVLCLLLQEVLHSSSASFVRDFSSLATL